MTLPTDMQRGLALRSYLAASHLLPLIARPILRKRLKRGKEHPTRWTEKLGQSLAPRPKGPLVWLHAVGLGEVLSLRGLISRMAAERPELSFLVTSSTAASAKVFGKNAPPRTIHQFLPLDAPTYRRKFLDHFRPDLCIWAEQDLWPGMVSDLAARDIPQCVVAARMNEKSYRSHQRASGLYHDLYAAMAMVTAQDEKTAKHLQALGARVTVSGSLKPAAPQLSCDLTELAAIKTQFADRMVWAVAPAHPHDIKLAQDAHRQLRTKDPSALLIIAPRFPDAELALNAPRRSKQELPSADDPVWLCDTFGDLGLVYRLADAALVGGSFTDIEGHNPWEAIALGCAVLHGPRTANFAADYAQLAAADGAVVVRSADDVTATLLDDSLGATVANAKGAVDLASTRTDKLAADMLQFLGTANAR